MQNIVTWGQNMSANIEEFACISMGGLFSGVPPGGRDDTGYYPPSQTRKGIYPTNTLYKSAPLAL